MEVVKHEDGAGTLQKLHLIRTGDEDFKKEVKAYMKKNYPDMSIAEVFDKMESYNYDLIVIRIV